MSRSGFFNKVVGQSIFRGATSRSLVIILFYWILIADIFLHFFIVVSYLGGEALCHGPTLGDPRRNQRQI